MFLSRSLAAVDTPFPGIYFALCSGKGNQRERAALWKSCLCPGDCDTVSFSKRGTAYSVYGNIIRGAAIYSDIVYTTTLRNQVAISSPLAVIRNASRISCPGRGRDMSVDVRKNVTCHNFKKF